MSKRVYFHRKGWRGTRGFAARRIQRAFRGRRRRSAIKTLFKRTRKEMKYIDQQGSNAVGNSYHSVFGNPLNYIRQGDGNSERIGNKITVHSITINGYVLVDDTTNFMRILVVRLGRCDPASAGITDILSDGSAASPFHLLSHKTRNGDFPYTILADRTLLLAGNNTTTSVSGPASQRKFRISIKLKGKKSQCYYKTDAANHPTDGYMYAIAATDSALSGPNTYLSSRVIFSG